MGDRPYLEGRVQVRVDVCIGSECVCVNGSEKEDHFVHCRQVVSKSNR